MARIGLAVAGAGVLAALAACGGGEDFADRSAEDIAESARSAMQDLKAVRMAGSVTSGGQETSLDIHASTGGDCTGTIGVGGGKAQLLGTDGTTWLRPDEAFWRASAPDQAEQIMALVDDKWVVVPAGEDLGGVCDVDRLLDQLLESGGGDATYERKGTEQLDGEEVVAVESTDADGTATGYVLVEEPHYLVKVDKTEGADTGSVSFSEFDEEFTVEPPADDEVVDLSGL